MTPVRSVRAVLDTNVIVSAFLWGGRPARLIELAGAEQVQLFTSRAMIAELESTLTKPKLTSALERLDLLPSGLLARYRLVTTLVKPKSATPVSRDPDDDKVIACAIAARADFIVTGDDDLLVLKQHEGIEIIRVAQALAALAI